MKLEILTAEKKLYEGRVNSITVPGSKGSFTILHNHAPVIATLDKGQVKIQPAESKSEVIDIEGGIIEVKKNTIIVLADTV